MRNKRTHIAKAQVHSISVLVACFFLMVNSGCRFSGGDALPDSSVVPPAYELEEDWTLLFDGASLEGWTASERDGSFRVVNGMIVAAGRRAHLFYTGPVADHQFTDFHFKADVRTTPGSNSGIYFHTAYQESDWPSQGYEAQVNSTHRDWRKTGSLYGVVDVEDAPVADNTWFTYEIIVQGQQIMLKVDGTTTVTYREPDDPHERERIAPGRMLSSGTFALQAHDRRSTVYFANLRVRPL